MLKAIADYFGIVEVKQPVSASNRKFGAERLSNAPATWSEQQDKETNMHEGNEYFYLKRVGNPYPTGRKY